MTERDVFALMAATIFAARSVQPNFGKDQADYKRVLDDTDDLLESVKNRFGPDGS